MRITLQVISLVLIIKVSNALNIEIFYNNYPFSMFHSLQQNNGCLQTLVKFLLVTFACENCTQS